MAAVAAFVLFVIAAIVAWINHDHAAAIAYAGLAAFALHFMLTYWVTGYRRA